MDLAKKRGLAMIGLRVMLPAIALGISKPVYSQDAIPPVSFEGNQTENNQTGLPLPAMRSTVDSTLNQASQKLKSSKVEERVGAAKLLGKYANAQVSLLLIGALDDSSELVRRAVIVSLVEHFNNGAPIYEQALVEKIFSKMGDPDVEVRRETSALIPRLIPGLMRSGMEKVQMNGRTIIRSVPGKLRPDLQDLANQALIDPDSIVRQNVLKHHFSLRFQMDSQTFVRLLGDKDVSVLLVALDQARIYATQTGTYEQMEALTKHSDVGVRAKLARTVQSLGRSFPQYRKILRILTDDPVDEVATLSAVDLARLGERVSNQMIDRIIAYLSKANGLFGKAESLFYSLSALGTDAKRIYSALLEHPSASMRAQAWVCHLSLSEGWRNHSSWRDALQDRDFKVRKAVLSLLRGRVEQINRNELSYLIKSRHVEVRSFASELLLVAEKEVVKECFFDLLIDEDSLVRSTTLRALAKIQADSWVDLHARSLKDKDYAIQRAAMDGLLGDQKVGVPALLKYLRQYPAERISTLARKELQQMGINP